MFLAMFFSVRIWHMWNKVPSYKRLTAVLWWCTHSLFESPASPLDPSNLLRRPYLWKKTYRKQVALRIRLEVIWLAVSCLSFSACLPENERVLLLLSLGMNSLWKWMLLSLDVLEPLYCDDQTILRHVKSTSNLANINHCIPSNINRCKTLYLTVTKHSLHARFQNSLNI